MPFQALIFDVGGVIIPHDQDALYARLAARCRAPDALERIAAGGDDPRWATGEITIEELHRRLADELRYGGAWDEFVEDFCAHLSLDEEMLAFVARLARSRRVFLFSNTNEVHWARVERLTGGRIGDFEAYLSHQIGAAKPDLDAFARVAERSGVEPGRCLFIDDNPANVDAARRAGFQAERFTTQAALVAQLARHGVAVHELQTGET
jgi:HAD superfamily hydrolase (TIGR01509 family)